MDTILNFMDMIYGNGKTLTIIYVVGAVLLLVFIVMLIISLKKPKKIIKKEELKSENNNTEVQTNDISIETQKEENNEKVKEEMNASPNVDIKISKDENPIEQALENIENKELSQEEPKEQKTEEKVDEQKLSSDIPNVDDFVDNVVKKTYEKNEQFSSVYNTTTVKLDSVLDKMNVDENVKEVLVESEQPKTEENVQEIDTKEDKVNETDIEIKENSVLVENDSNKPINSLDLLKQSLDEKKKETNETTIKQEELKEKLANLNKTETPIEETKKEEAMNPEDLLKKLNAMKEK